MIFFFVFDFSIKIVFFLRVCQMKSIILKEDADTLAVVDAANCLF